METKLVIYQVDAFAEKLFEGNPAAVIPLKKWLPKQTMQNIALENNLSETAFFIPENENFHIRWFTPVSEVDLCGHATLASAHVVFNHLNFNKSKIIFYSKRGALTVEKENEMLMLNFPSSKCEKTEIPQNLMHAFNRIPQKCFKGKDDYMLVFNSEQEILDLQPDFQQIIKSKTRGIICTSESAKLDFVSRFFAPAVGVNEDPVTGSAHTMLIPYWAAKLGKDKLIAKQLSARSGILWCQNLGSRVKIGGKALTYLVGEITI